MTLLVLFVFLSLSGDLGIKTYVVFIVELNIYIFSKLFQMLFNSVLFLIFVLRY